MKYLRTQNQHFGYLVRIGEMVYRRIFILHLVFIF